MPASSPAELLKLNFMGAFSKYEPITNASEIKTIHNMEEFIEGAKEMETNHIVHATEENLPVYLLD